MINNYEESNDNQEEDNQEENPTFIPPNDEEPINVEGAGSR